MNRGEVKRESLVALAALILGALVGQIALASGGKPAGAITLGKAELRELIRDEVARSAAATAAAKKGRRGPRGRQDPAGAPGPQGPQGTAGTAPACQGNGSGDAMVAAGAVCIDKYEASVWSSPTGGTQYGIGSDDYPCDDEGHDCTNIYARSVPGEAPSRYITYFQAQQALANVGKRLPSNAEWQQAVAGSPDPGPDNDTTDCHVDGGPGAPIATGSRSACVSRFGAFDMVGNVSEWVADWVPASGSCPGWGNVGTFSSGDRMCLSGVNAAQTGPGAIFRGGAYNWDTASGPFFVEASFRPSDSDSASIPNIGFRGAR